MGVYFADPAFQRQGVVGGFVLSAPDYSGTPPGTGASISFTYAVANITVLGKTVKIATGYQHQVNIGGGVFSYVQQNSDTASTVATYLANAINSAADALCTATHSGGTLTLTPRLNTGAAIPCTASLSCGTPNGQTLFELTGNELIPTIGKGVLFAQATLYNPAVAPILPAAPASQQSWLFYSSTAGWYWKNSSSPNNATDATVGWVVTNATSVIAISSRKIGSGAEVSIVPAGPSSLLLGSAGEDTGVPPLPNFTAAETNSQLVIGGLTLASSTNSAEISFAEFLLYYVNETAGTTLTLTAALTAGATSLSASAALPASTPGSVTFNFSNVTVGSVTIGPGYVHSISIGAATYTYEQQTEDTAAIIATALAEAIDASADPNAYATATGGTVVLTALQNTGGTVTCSASDANTPANLTESEPTYVTIDQEIVQVNAANGSAIARGVLGSTAAAHASGAKIWPVTEETMVFAIPLFSYGTPNWPTVVGQIPFAGQALVAASCWVANEIGPSPICTKCFTGQGPYAVDAEGNPLAPDVAGFTATVTTNINVAGQPYYQFSGTVTVGPAPGSTPEIDVAMTSSAGVATVVYRLMGPFTANAVLNWTSVLFPEPATGPTLTFTPTVVPLNVDGVPTVSSYTVGALSVPNGTVTPVAPAPNVLATGTTASVTTEGMGNGTGFSFSGSIALPSTYALINAIAVNAISPTGQREQIALLSAAQITGVSLTYTGTFSFARLMTPAAQTGWTVEFQVYNASGAPTSSPYTTAAITIPALGISALSGSEVGLYALAAGGQINAQLQANITVGQPGTYTLWTIGSVSGIIFQGWYQLPSGASTVQIGAPNSNTYFPCPTTANDSVTFVAVPNAVPWQAGGVNPTTLSGAVQSSPFTVTMPAAGSAMASSCYADTILYTKSTGGASLWSIPNMYATFQRFISGVANANFFYARLYYQRGAGTGASFVAIAGSTPAVITDDTNGPTQVSQNAIDFPIANWGVPSDANTTFRFWWKVASRQGTTIGGGQAVEVQQNSCWVNGYAGTLYTDGSGNEWYDVAVDPTKAQISAALLQPGTLGAGLYQNPVTGALQTGTASNPANMLANWSFEDNGAVYGVTGAAVSGWTVAGNTEQWTGYAHSGSGSLRMVGPGSITHCSQQFSCNQQFGYYASAWVNNYNSGSGYDGEIGLALEFLNASGGSLGFTYLANSMAAAQGAWQQLSGVVPAASVPAGAASVVFYVYLAVAATNSMWFVDDCVLTPVISGNQVQAGVSLTIDSNGFLQVNTGTGLSSVGTQVTIPAGAITNTLLAALSVATGNIQNAAIATAKIQNGAVTATQIANATIGTAQIANGAITTALIGTAQITTALIANAAITDALIANCNVGKLIAGTANFTGTVVLNSPAGCAITMSGTQIVLSSGGSTGNPSVTLTGSSLTISNNQSGASAASLTLGASSVVLASGSSATLTLTATMLSMVVVGSNSQITLDNAGNAVFTGSLGSSTTINGSSIATGSISAASLSLTASTISFPAGIGGFTTATAGSATLPANPVGFLEVNVGGTTRKVPYYAV